MGDYRMGAERGKRAMKDESSLFNHDFIVKCSKPYRDQPAIYFLIHGGEVVYVGRSSNVNLRIGHHINKQQKPFDRYYAVYCDVKDLDQTERGYIEKFQPKYNVHRNKGGYSAVKHADAILDAAMASKMISLSANSSEKAYRDG
jgi:hypothetical protein